MKVLEFAHATYPTLPLTLHGHSLGSLVAVIVALRHRATLASLNLRSVIIECPWLFPSPARTVNFFQRWSIWLISLVNPNFQIPRGVSTITGDLDPRWTTLIRAVQGTPTYPNYLTAKLALSAASAQQFVRENARRWPPDVPLLALQGGRDTAVGIDGNSRWITEVSEIEGARVTYRVWPEGTHFLMKLPCRNEVLNEIFGFIGK
jgi:alpha-beta hydrolase superfamily lysophospholipase